jgi:hypothetical protein
MSFHSDAPLPRCRTLSCFSSCHHRPIEGSPRTARVGQLTVASIAMLTFGLTVTVPHAAACDTAAVGRDSGGRA